MKKRIVTPLILFTLFISQVVAQDIGLKGLGGKIGYIMPDGEIENTVGLGVQADLGQYNEKISLAAYLDYWGKSYDVPNYEWSWSVVSIAAVAKYGFEARGSVTPYAGVGVGLDIGKSEAKYTGPTGGFFGVNNFSSSSSNTDFAIHFIGGGKMELTPKVDGIAEVKYTIGGADYFGVYVGAIYKLN